MLLKGVEPMARPRLGSKLLIENTSVIEVSKDENTDNDALPLKETK
jgi:hypothetical protein